MPIFHPDNNLGVEIFFIGIVGMVIFELCFGFWIWYSNHKWRLKRKNEMSQMWKAN